MLLRVVWQVAQSKLVDTDSLKDTFDCQDSLVVGMNLNRASFEYP